MHLDYAYLDSLRRHHPAWRLLAADHGPLVASFLHRSFITTNVRVFAQAELASKLDDYLFNLRETLDNNPFPKAANQYLDDWASNERGWLRKFYPPDSDEAHFDISPAAEKAIEWLTQLTGREFIGTESRLLTVFELLRQMMEGSETDPQVRIRELEKRKADLDNQIQRIQNGELDILDDTAIKDRFQQVVATARGLLADFREVEQNFRNLDRRVRERVAQWEGGKGALLDEIFGERDEIADSDQGKSFRAFWDFLMSPARQEELSALLNGVFTLDAVRTLRPDARLKRVHYDWLEAGEHTQRTVARLTQQLRHFLDDQAWLENRRIMQIVHSVESHALAIRDNPPSGTFTEVHAMSPSIDVPMDRPLYNPPLKPAFDTQALTNGSENMNADVLFNQPYVDKAKLVSHIRRALQTRTQITLMELLLLHPLKQGLAELVTYLSLAGSERLAVIDEKHTDRVNWIDARGRHRQAHLPRVIFCRG